ncbi:inorganic phosphate transporter [Stutzerimonas kirkiae]|uniref:Phosphate transporter n=1 Tax=Stutzerimonas kirkiae TaxID=2211392 RepID=A0A4V2KC89_9GAMM|nr:inorganic phosphate transporter [Stutzerimonas kirkiae]TBU92629.1 phosphate permease [Stutzerimonas kirkiae]TBV00821.1 phosphate permease [Stutzerimonas kirkiae]TBV08712.1 phosphate permease [Stutzerimonas kirkiae]TBV11504.1 phosphate permease [Stutzerimonas kirkiae]
MSFITEYGTVLLVLACCFGFFMAWGVGANDVSNAMGTSVGSKALTIRQAILIAMFFEFFGAYLAGGQVAETIKNGIVDASQIEPDLFVLGMMSALLSAGTWLLIASLRGWPVSTTHTIVGAIIGFAAIGISVDTVNWIGLLPIVSSWVVTPFISGLIAFGIFKSVQWLIMDTEDPFRNAKRWVPGYMFLTGFMLALMTFTKGLKHVGLDFSGLESFLYSVLIGVLVAALGISLLTRIQVDPEANRAFHFASVEKVFAVLMIFTACSMAFAHGASDVSNAVGPLAAVVGVIHAGGDMAIGGKSSVPGWVLLLGAVGIVIGLATYGWKVMATIGKGITELTPSRGFAAELATAITVVTASGIGLPISTTHTLVGAVLGIGLARGIGALNLGMIGKIFSTWVITLPAGALFAIIYLEIMMFIFL